MFRGYRALESVFNLDPGDITNSAGRQLYEELSIEWTKPVLWEPGQAAPVPQDLMGNPCIYAVVRNHWRQVQKDEVVYVGLTKDPAKRFANHPKASEISSLRGQTSLSFGRLTFKARSAAQKSANISNTLEQIEHLYIRTLEPLHNDRKVWMLPGDGKNRVRAWQIYNVGYRFSGRMPREIVFPWILVKPGRDRSSK